MKRKAYLTMFLIAATVVSATAFSACSKSSKETTESTPSETDSSKDNTSDLSESDEENTQIANPWVESDKDTISESLGVKFNEPEGATDITYRFNETIKMAEMEFTIDGNPYTARAQDTTFALEASDGQDSSDEQNASATNGASDSQDASTSDATSASQYTDISGLYYTWESEEETSVFGNPAAIKQATDENTQIQVIVWTDTEKSLSYSLYTEGEDLDGLDLAALAEQIFAQ